MRVIREEQVSKAIEYMRSMKLAKLFIDAVCNSPEFLHRFWAELWECPQLGERMKKLEENGSLPYYVTHESFSFGECYTILTVSPYAEDFTVAAPRYDEGMKAYRAYGYVWNVTDDSSSEPGMVWVENQYGAVHRIL